MGHHIKHSITDPQALSGFTWGGYSNNTDMLMDSEGNIYVLMTRVRKRGMLKSFTYRIKPSPSFQKYYHGNVIDNAFIVSDADSLAISMAKDLRLAKQRAQEQAILDSKFGTKTIRQQLIEHLSGDGTLNDSTTCDLYRKAMLYPSTKDFELEELEKWAVRLLS